MKVTVCSYIWFPEISNYIFFTKASCIESETEIELMPNSIESYMEYKDTPCRCGKDHLKGKFYITTKSGSKYAIKENPLSLMEKV